MSVSELPSTDTGIKRTDYAAYGFTVETHPSGHTFHGPGDQVVLSGDRLLGQFDDYHELFDDDPTIVESDTFAETLIDYIISGIKTDIELLKEYEDMIDEEVGPVIDAYETAIDELKTELSVWIVEYRRFVRLAYPDSGVRDDREIWEFKQQHPYDFHGVTDTYDIIIDTLKTHISGGDDT